VRLLRDALLRSKAGGKAVWGRAATTVRFSLLGLAASHQVRSEGDLLFSLLWTVEGGASCESNF